MMTARRIVSRVLLSMLALAGTLSLGCGSREGTISGEVKYNGQPIPSGTITFLSEASRHQVVSADIIDGRYTLTGTQPGPAKVTVVTTPPSRGGLPPGGGRPIDAPGVHTAAPRKYMPINRRYASPDQSGLKYDVQPGTQVKDFDLPR